MNLPHGKEDCVVDHKPKPGQTNPIDDLSEIFVPTPDKFKRERIIGEMAGALKACVIFIHKDEINKEYISEILRRYDEEFNGETGCE